MKKSLHPSSSSRHTIYRQASPAQSNTSLSDDDGDDEDFNKSTFFAPAEPVAASPAQWSRTMSLPSPVDTLRSSSSHAMKLPPEILIHILKHLHSPRDLYHCVLVSRSWCECSVELLWHRPNFTKLSTLGKMMRVLSGDDQTFLYARFIRRLNFSYLGGELTDVFFSRLAQCVRLERLTLLNCSNITDGALARVLPCCPNLVALDLTGVGEASDRAIVALASSTKRLQGINLGGCKKLTDQAIQALAANCPLLRRVKLGGLELITDEAVSALAKSCPLLLEIDLTHCKQITDVSVRDLWMFSTNMREMRLSHCSELTDSAFPAPPKNEIQIDGPNPFPTSNVALGERMPPLRITRRFDHLRLLDLTACSAITDEAVEGIVSVAPKIRNLVLAKCTHITDHAVECICALGKNLHYLHLGHASNITDRSVRTLARSCTRLRYIDLANCVQLTDMSVFELSSLPKLRRIGLVRVSNLTDQAIYALGEGNSTLERIHLSYCDQITVLAIHFLLQKLSKLTHLSLTGIPAFRRTELQQFCREPPPEFNSTQRSTFCVYSGKGVTDLRVYLSDLYNAITEDGAQQSGTEYEYESEDTYRVPYTAAMEVIDDGDDEQDDDEDMDVAPIIQISQLTPTRRNGANGHAVREIAQQYIPMDVQATPQFISRELFMTRERGSVPTSRGSSGHASPAGPTSIPGPSRRGRGFGQQPIVELSTSPAPSDAASNRSGGTNHSTGTGFFRNYVEAANSTRAGVITPDLVFAEIGHGRGMGPSPGTNGQFSPRREQPMVVPASPPSFPPRFSAVPNGGSSSQIPIVEDDHRTNGVNGASGANGVHGVNGVNGFNGYPVLNDSSNSYQRTPPRTESTSSWTQIQHEDAQPLSSASRELHDSVQSALGGPHAYADSREVDARGRSVKRSLRSTINAAEHYASSFLFGRGSNPNLNEGPSAPQPRRDSMDQPGH
ncbi:RNI-like protein [Phanerochaete sordida]|uniref:RNI-like protein n=1 Tax=Phanerochaete sordida TaxID=48140 RepID=A0A9P3L7I5_9APHY|nr:RNI-like protein [Phanerochaete sordida]